MALDPGVALVPVALDDPWAATVLSHPAAEYDRLYGGGVDEMARTTAEDFAPPGGGFLVAIDGGEVVAGASGPWATAPAR